MDIMNKHIISIEKNISSISIRDTDLVQEIKGHPDLKIEFLDEDDQNENFGFLNNNGTVDDLIYMDNQLTLQGKDRTIVVHIHMEVDKTGKYYQNMYFTPKDRSYNNISIMPSQRDRQKHSHIHVTDDEIVYYALNAHNMSKIEKDAFVVRISHDKEALDRLKKLCDELIKMNIPHKK